MESSSRFCSLFNLFHLQSYALSAEIAEEEVFYFKTPIVMDKVRFLKNY